MSDEEKSYELKKMHDRNLYLNKQLKEKNKIIDKITKKIEDTIINCDGQAEDLIDEIYEILKGEDKE